MDDARWNAARAFATYLDHHREMYVGMNVLELGAGGGLPGIVTVLNGAKKVSSRFIWCSGQRIRMQVWFLGRYYIDFCLFGVDYLDGLSRPRVA